MLSCMILQTNREIKIERKPQDPRFSVIYSLPRSLAGQTTDNSPVKTTSVVCEFQPMSVDDDDEGDMQMNISSDMTKALKEVWYDLPPNIKHVGNGQ